MPTLTQQAGTEVDVDNDARDVFSRMKALADYPELTTTIDEVVASLCAHVRIHASYIDEFPRRFGKQIRAAGGRFDECRGHQTTRYIYAPNTPELRPTLDAILAEAKGDGFVSTKQATVIAEGRCCAPMNGNASSWITVHTVSTMAEFEVKVRKAVEQAVERGLIQLSWPDPRSRS